MSSNPVFRFLSGLFSRTAADSKGALRGIADVYLADWPDWSDTYRGWKPISLLPASKESVKSSLKLAYAEWPEPVDWTVFSGFAMEFVDICSFISQSDLEFLASVEGRPVSSNPQLTTAVSLITVRPLPARDWLTESAEREARIARTRDDFLVRSVNFDYPTLSDAEIGRCRDIVLGTMIESAALAEEWSLYCTSIGRDSYVGDEES